MNLHRMLAARAAERRLVRNVAAHATVRWEDIKTDSSSEAVRFRRGMEAAFGR
jgi:hypothetical protein